MDASTTQCIILKNDYIFQSVCYGTSSDLLRNHRKTGLEPRILKDYSSVCADVRLYKHSKEILNGVDGKLAAV